MLQTLGIKHFVIVDNSSAGSMSISSWVCSSIYCVKLNIGVTTLVGSNATACKSIKNFLVILVLFHPLIIMFFIFSCSSSMQHATNQTILVCSYIFILKSTFGHCPSLTWFSMIDIIHALNWTLKTCFTDHCKSCL